MKLSPLLFFLVIGGRSLLSNAWAGDGTFDRSTNGTYSWDNSGNWASGGIADGAGFTATFAGTGTATGNPGLIITLDTNRTIGNLTFNSSPPRPYTLTGPGILTLERLDATAPTISVNLASGRTVTISAVLAGTQGLQISVASGPLILSGANTYSGVTTIGGATTLNHNSALGAGGTGNGTVVNSSLTVGSGITITNEALTLNGNLYGANSAEWAGTVSLGGSARIGANSGSTLTMSGVISGGQLTIGPSSGGATGTTVLSAVNNYTGATQIYRGTLKIDGGNNRLPTGTVLQVGGANSEAPIFDLNGWNQQVAGLAFSSASNVAATVTNSSSTASILTLNGTTNRSFLASGTGNTSILTGNLSLVKAGSFTQTLSATTSYTGSTTVTTGTLVLQSATLADAADVYLEGTGILNLNFTGTDVINQLYFNGIAQTGGTWGSLASSADNKSAFFLGNGILSVAVIPEPATTWLLLLGGSLLVMARRRKS